MAETKHTYPLKYVTENLNSIIAEFMTQYTDELQSKTEKITEEVAKDFAEQLKTVTPRSEVTAGDPHLADTIVVTGKKEKKYGTLVKSQYVHYTKWQIAHLLEFGWTLKNGKKLERQPFIRPLFDKNKEKYYKAYKEGLSR